MYAFFLPKRIFKIFSTLIFSFIFLVTILIRAHPSFATEIGTYNPYPAANAAPEVQNNLHNHTQEVFMEFLSTVVCQISGIDVTTPDHRCLGFSATGQIGYVNNKNLGAIGMVSNGIAALYSGLPIHTTDYLSYLHNHFGVVHPAYADQTTSNGYQGLSPLLGIWVVMRNITYLLTVLIFIFIGFAVMLRVKIDPRTVMTIENQIPKIVIGLILITFSFAISGLMVDLMYIMMFVFYNIYASIPGINKSALTPQVLQGTNPWDVISAMYPGGGWALTLNAGSSFADMARHIIGFDKATWNPFDPQNGPFSSGLGVGSLTSFNFISFAVDVVSWLMALKVFFGVATTVSSGFDFPLVGIAVGGGAGLAAGLAIYDLIESAVRTIAPYLIIDALVLIALFIAMVKLFVALLTSWVTILYYVVLGPLLIFFGLIPGVEGGFSNWIKHMAANLFVYPLTAAILMVGSAIIQGLTSPTVKGTVFVPPLVGGGSLPVGILLGLVVMFVASNAPQMAKDIFKVKDDKNTGAFGAMIGSSTQMLYKGGRATYSAFGKVPMPGARGGFQAALGQLG